MPILKTLLSDPAGSWRAMTQSQRIGLMVAIAVMASAGIVAYLWASAPTFVPLYTGLSSRSGGQVISALGKMSIPYRVSAGGAVIKVPASDANSVRLKLAAQGLPSSGKVSYESLESEPLGTSDFVQHVQYQQAVSTALSRTIESLSAVQSARVTLAIPPRPIFMDDTRKPTASVLLVLRPGTSLEGRQVVGIQHLVASAVVGLSDSDVSVVDQNGNLLNGTSGGPLGDGTGQLGYREQVERRLEAQVVALLSPIVGEKHVRVSVAADINYAKVKTAAIVYGKSHVLSEQWHLSSDGASGKASGVPGALSHVPPGAASAPFSASAGRSATALAVSGTSGVPRDQSRTVNYQNDRTVTEEVAPAGAIKRLSVAVLIDQAAVGRNGSTTTGVTSVKTGKTGKSAKTVKRVKSAISSGEIARLTQLVKDSIGFDAARGDSVSVMAVPFAAPEVSDPPSAPWWSSPLVPVLGRYLAGLVGLVLIWFLILRPVLRAAVGRMDSSSGADLNNLPEHAGEAEAAVQRMARNEANLAAQLGDAHVAVDRDPAAAARVIRRWMSNDS